MDARQNIILNWFSIANFNLRVVSWKICKLIIFYVRIDYFRNEMKIAVMNNPTSRLLSICSKLIGENLYLVIIHWFKVLGYILLRSPSKGFQGKRYFRQNSFYMCLQCKAFVSLECVTQNKYYVCILLKGCGYGLICPMNINKHCWLINTEQFTYTFLG